MAQRRHFISNEVNIYSCPDRKVSQTECPVCDYLMAMCSLNGNVLEAQFPGISITKKKANT